MPGGLIPPVQEVSQHRDVDGQIRLLICTHSAYNNLVTTGMSKAFDFNQAAIDVLDALSAGTGNQAADVAKSDLLDYTFVSARPGRGQRVDPNNQNFKRVRATFNAVKKFAHFQGTFRPQVSVSISEVVVYCDYSRFDGHEDKDCSGVEKKRFACDPHVRLEVEMNEFYKDCKDEFGFETDVSRHVITDFLWKNVRAYSHRSGIYFELGLKILSDTNL